jgi:hypothetical protein
MDKHNAYVQVLAGNKYSVICPKHDINRRFQHYPEAVETVRKHNHIFETLAWSPDE